MKIVVRIENLPHVPPIIEHEFETEDGSSWAKPFIDARDFLTAAQRVADPTLPDETTL